MRTTTKTKQGGRRWDTLADRVFDDYPALWVAYEKLIDAQIKLNKEGPRPESLSEFIVVLESSPMRKQPFNPILDCYLRVAKRLRDLVLLASVAGDQGADLMSEIASIPNTSSDGRALHDWQSVHSVFDGMTDDDYPPFFDDRGCCFFDDGLRRALAATWMVALAEKGKLPDKLEAGLRNLNLDNIRDAKRREQIAATVDEILKVIDG